MSNNASTLASEGLPTDLVAAAAQAITRHGIVIFAGAGVSANPPSGVPGWFALNAIILRALQHRVTSYLGRDPRWLEEVIQAIIARRDQGSFPPAYQAQIVEEQCGESYFHALAAVDLEQRNAAHEAIAALAKSGHVRGIVTTNFDCLIERALAAYGVKFEVALDEPGFRRAAQGLAANTRKLWVAKLHGCATKPLSMIDTLRQRLLGRKTLLEKLLVPWLRRHFVIYVGFSAADLNHDRDYLGLREAAGNSAGAWFVRYPGSKLEPGAQALVDAYGGSSQCFEAKLEAVFYSVLKALQTPTPEPPRVVLPDVAASVRARAQKWAAALQPYEAINALATLLDAGGEEGAAFEVLHRTWESRLSSDSAGAHYARYQYNYARHCLEAGEMRYEETPENFYRSADMIPEAVVGAALFWFYRGLPEQAARYLSEAERVEAGMKNPRLSGDLWLFRARRAVVYHEINLFEALVHAGNRQRKAGDLPRAARLWTLAARLAAHAGDMNNLLGLSEPIEGAALYLGDQSLQAEMHLAQAIAFLKGGASQTGLSNLQESVPTLLRLERWPALIEALIESIRFTLIASGIDATRDLFQEAKQRIVGRYDVYYPLLKLVEAEHYARTGQAEWLKRVIEEAAPLAKATGNEWACQQFAGLIPRSNSPDREGVTR